MQVLTDQQEIKALCAFPAGASVVVESIGGGRGVKARLADLGIFRGTELTILSNLPNGPVLVAVRDARYFLGRGMVEKIFVR